MDIHNKTILSPPKISYSVIKHVFLLNKSTISFRYNQSSFPLGLIKY